MREPRTYTISELAQEFDVTARTIRYYEQFGLVSPRRQGQRRLYSERDRVRLRLALRGRRLGFALEEIAEMLDLYDRDPRGREQLQRALAYGREKMRELERRRVEIDLALEELRSYERRLSALLAERSAD